MIVYGLGLGRLPEAAKPWLGFDLRGVFKSLDQVTKLVLQPGDMLWEHFYNIAVIEEINLYDETKKYKNALELQTWWFSKKSIKYKVKKINRPKEFKNICSFLCSSLI
jgi:hypothetical protein